MAVPIPTYTLDWNPPIRLQTTTEKLLNWVHYFCWRYCHLDYPKVTELCPFILDCIRILLINLHGCSSCCNRCKHRTVTNHTTDRLKPNIEGPPREQEYLWCISTLYQQFALDTPAAALLICHSSRIPLSLISLTQKDGKRPHWCLLHWFYSLCRGPRHYSSPCYY